MRTKLGDLVADLGASEPGGKRTYYKIGTAFQEGERISIKIDTLPLPNASWSGWCNVFASKPREPRDMTQPGAFDRDPDSDIPF